MCTGHPDIDASCALGPTWTHNVHWVRRGLMCTGSVVDASCALGPTWTHHVHWVRRGRIMCTASDMTHHVHWTLRKILPIFRTLIIQAGLKESVRNKHESVKTIEITVCWSILEDKIYTLAVQSIEKICCFITRPVDCIANERVLNRDVFVKHTLFFGAQYTCI